MLYTIVHSPSRLIWTVLTSELAPAGVLVYIYCCVYFFVFFNATATIRMALESFCFRAVVCVHPWSYATSLLAQRLINHFWQFYQIHNFGAVGDKVNWLDFKVRGYALYTCTLTLTLTLRSQWNQMHFSSRGVPVDSLPSKTCMETLISKMTCCLLSGMLLTLCVLIGQKTHWVGLGLGRSVRKEVHPCFPYFTRAPPKVLPDDPADSMCWLLYWRKNIYSSLVYTEI